MWNFRFNLIFLPSFCRSSIFVDFLLTFPLTAGHPEGTFLTIQGIELEIHWAGES